MIYGANGVGKTTLLESLSLLGYIGCATRVVVSRDGALTYKASLLHEAMRHRSMLPDEETPTLAESLRTFLGRSLEGRRPHHARFCDLFPAKTYRTNTERGRVRLEVEAVLDVTQVHEIIVVVTTGPGQSLTRLLSSDARGSSEWRLQAHLAWIYPAEAEAALTALGSHFLDQAPFESPSGGFFRLSDAPWDERRAGLSYVNSDCNDPVAELPP